MKLLNNEGPWSPLKNKVFLVLWLATLFSNIGTWMQNAGAGWLMISLNPDPFVVSLVQVATVFPMFIFALPAGSLADIFDRRKILLIVQIILTVLMSILGLLVSLHYITPFWLLLFTFFSGMGAAIIVPSWQAIVPQLIPKSDLAKAITLNGISMNISRAIGPALTGLVIAFMGLSAPFWLNAISNLGIIWALIWWKPENNLQSKLPAERFMSSMKMGIRHVSANMRLKATIVKSATFFLFSSTYWALLPLIASEQIKGGPTFYGMMLGMIGVGAIAGTFLLPALRKRFNADQLVVIGSIGTSFALVLFGLAKHPTLGILASLIAGLSWIMALPTFSVIAQFSLPNWVKGRGMALYTTIIFGAMALGSAFWGQLAKYIGISWTHYFSAVGMLISLVLIKRWKLHRDNDIDLTPSNHWRNPEISFEVENNEGPVLITIQYFVLNECRGQFLQDLKVLSRQRIRTGAYKWHIFEDLEKENVFLEIFLVETWLEHLRQHERIIRHDLILKERINTYLSQKPVLVTHYIAR